MHASAHPPAFVTARIKERTEVDPRMRELCTMLGGEGELPTSP